jgi:hypothetical protein
VNLVNGYFALLQKLNGLDFHGVDDPCEADEEIDQTLQSQHRVQRLQVVLHVQVFALVVRTVHLHNRV